MNNIISDNMREFWKQEDRDPKAMAERIKYLVENPGVIDGLCDKTLIAVPSVKSVPAQIVSDWQKFFDHLRILDSSFNEDHFPLEEDKLR